MWRSWNKSTAQIHSTTSSSPSSSSFHNSSFKDIQSLFSDEPPPQTPRAAAVFRRVRLATSLLKTWSTQSDASISLPDPPSKSKTLTFETDVPPPAPPYPAAEITIPGAEERIVVYYTSLRVVRSTFDDCRTVRLILRGLRRRMDERDVSMDVAYMRELERIIGAKKVMLPRVFIGGRYVGGADEVKQMNEIGELRKLVEGLPAEDLRACGTCGGHRFVLCEACNGSRKMYTEKISGFKICTACNENGLIRCPSCCFDLLLS